MQTAANLSVIVLASSRFFRFRGCKRASTHCRKAQEEDQMINQSTPLKKFLREMEGE